MVKGRIQNKEQSPNPAPNVPDVSPSWKSRDQFQPAGMFSPGKLFLQSAFTPSSCACALGQQTFQQQRPMLCLGHTFMVRR